MNPEMLLNVLGFLVAGGGAYAAIRFDLGRLHEKAEAAARSAVRAHERIDGHLQNHHGAPS